MEWAAALIWQSLDDGGVLGDTVTREHRCGRAAAEAVGESTRGIDLLTGGLPEAHPGAPRRLSSYEGDLAKESILTFVGRGLYSSLTTTR